MTPFGEYCPYAKAAEHLGDRWSLLIVKELAMHGSLGFNALAAGLPGVSRSVLTRRLRKLEELGLVARDPFARSRVSPYRLAPAGQQLVPTLLSLDAWARRWVPEDPALAQRDPDVITFWLANRVDVGRLPERQVVVVFSLGGAPAKQHWLVLERGAAPSICLEDPGLAADRYVYVEADAAALYPVSRGVREWTAAIGERSVRLYGDPALVKALPRWFGAAASDAKKSEHLVNARRSPSAEIMADQSVPRSGLGQSPSG
ncbi:MAG: winged helix-turn-helix transcriptional regulator [Candidatus Limnocylindria bacterium]